MTTFDEDFTDEDFDAALNWQAEQAAKCSGCGLPADETMDPANADAYDARLVACHACAARERAERAFLQEHNPDTTGLKSQLFENE